MTRRPENVVSLSGPFRGLDVNAPADTIHPFSAVTAHNVITAHGSIDVRDPLELFANFAAVPNMVNYPLSFETTIANVARRCLYSWYRRSDGAAFNIVMLDDGTLKVSRPQGTDTRAIPVFANDALYVFSYGSASTSYKYYYDDTLVPADWNYDKIGIAPPTFVTCAEQGTGTLPISTTYYYRLSFLNSVLGEEGAYCAQRSVTTVNNNTRIMLQWAAPATGVQVDRLRIYRYRPGMDDTYYLLEEIDEDHTARTYYDDGSVVPTKLYTDRLPVGAAIPPDCTAAAWWKGYMWWVPSANEGTIRHSLFGKCELGIPSDSYSAGDNDASPIVAPWGAENVLLLLKRDSVWGITGNSEESFVCSRITNGYGCYSRHSVCETDDSLYWVGLTGIYRWMNGGPALISRKVAPLWKSFSTTGLNYSTSAWDEYHNIVIFNIPYGSTAMQLVYHPDTGEWTRWSIPAFAVTSFRGTTGTMARPHFFMADGTTRIARQTSDQAQGADWGIDAIPAEWKTGQLTLGTRRRKKFYFARTAWDSSSSQDKVSLDAFIDDIPGRVATNCQSTDAMARDMQVRVAGVGDSLALSVNVEAKERLRITALDIDADLVGYR
jgi:hypothetical protein